MPIMPEMKYDETTAVDIDTPTPTNDMKADASIRIDSAAAAAAAAAAASPSRSPSPNPLPYPVSSQRYLDYIRALHAAWKDAPPITIAYKDLEYVVRVPVDETVVPSISTVLRKVYDRLTCHGRPTRDLHVFAKATGVIRPGKMTMILAPPGAGKSQFLKTIVGHMQHEKSVTGHLLYNGLSASDNLRYRQLYAHRLCTLIAQGDIHMPNLTVKEILQFAAQNALVKPTHDVLPEATEALTQLHSAKSDLLIDALGLQECANTIAGNAIIRGISGGQKKRLTVGEMIITNARVICMDEPSTGLDAAVARDLMATLRGWSEISGGTVVAALLQPTPEVMALFDDLILMREGEIVYQGPLADVGHYLETYCGIIPPPTQDLADFIVDYLTEPERAYHKQQRRQRQQTKKQQKQKQKGQQQTQTQTQPQPQPQAQLSEQPMMTSSTEEEDEGDVVVFHAANDNETPSVATHVSSASTSTSTSDIVVLPSATDSQSGSMITPVASKPAITLEEMVTAYHTSPFYHQQQQQAETWLNLERQILATPVPTHKTTLHSAAAAGAAPAAAAASVDPFSTSTQSEYTRRQFGRRHTHSLWSHIGMTMHRQFVLLKRDKQVIPPRLFSAVFMALVFGSLTSNLGLFDVYSKFGVLLFAIMSSAMGNFTELPATLEGRNVIYKQVDAGFFPSISYVFSLAVASVPVMVAETFLFSVILYFLVGFVKDAGRFFFFCLILFVSNLFISSMYRMICYISLSVDVAQQVLNPVFAIFNIFGGFMITRLHVPNWLIWLYYLSPFSWGLRSLAQNEFHAPEYDRIMSSGSTLGDTFLSQFEVQTDPAFRWAGVGYLVGVFLFFILTGAYFLQNKRFDLFQGTKRKQQQQQQQQGEEEKENETPVSPKQSNGQHIIQVQAAPVAVAVAVATTSQVRSRDSVESSSDLSSSSHRLINTSSIPFVPASLSFEHLKYTIQLTGDARKNNKKNTQNNTPLENQHASGHLQNQDGNGEVELQPVGMGGDKSKSKSNNKSEQRRTQRSRVLLDDVSGYVLPGQLCALMGASGAGKTTLMDVIASRKTAGVMEGVIKVNGVPKDEKLFRRITGYVEQQDIHSPLATVRESLLFSATLRLSRSVSPTTIETFVDQVLDLLELTPLANRIVGNANYTGLSPGQLKLLTIGVELVANPSILFLDEPTSGLDARAAFMVMRAVQNIVRTGRTVLCTIHQPSTEVFLMFDRLLLLRSGGRTAYFGDVQTLVPYFENINGPNTLQLPQGMNPATWMLDVIAAPTAKPAQEYHDMYAKSDIWQTESAILEREGQPKAIPSEMQAFVKSGDTERPTLATQFYVVLRRSLISSWRDTASNIGRVMTLIIIGIIFGLVYLKLDDTSYAGVNSMVASIFATVGFSAMVQSQLAIPNVISDRAVYYRERASNAYPPIVYAAALTLVEIPWVAISSMLAVIPFYWMVGLQASAGLFFKFYAVHALLCLTMVAYGQLAGLLFPSFVVAIQVSGLFVMMFFLFGGLFVRPSAIPKGWKWFFYLNPIPKAIIAICLSQYECDAPDPYNNIDECPSIMVVYPEGEVRQTTHSFINSIFEAGYDTYNNYIAYLIASYATFLLCIYLTIRYVSHLKR